MKALFQLVFGVFSIYGIVTAIGKIRDKKIKPSS